ncbi:MAG: glucose/sorbosone family PQQ-dependent dehydrogenase [Acidobacteriota bacterium]
MPISCLVIFLAWIAVPAQDAVPGTEQFSMRVVATGLENPWQMRWGPDGRIWVTERTGKRIVRINPADGSKSVALTIPDVVQHHAQDGVLGLALHPDLLKNRGSDFVYVALTHDVDPGPAEVRGLTVRRYVYDAATQTLGSPTVVIDKLPAGNDHISGRLVFGLDQKLYLTIGDQGYNQLALFCSPIHAQELPTPDEVRSGNFQKYEGKILRIALDGSVPADNPMLNGARSHVYSYGHRNAQGLAQTADGKLYASEHGPSMDDELNLIQAGKNYGWPFVAGYRDDRVYVYANWSLSAPAPCASLTFNDIVAPPSVPQQKETAWSAPNFMPPIRTFFTVGPEYRFASQGNATIAPSGIDIYTVTGGGIPGWAHSVLVTGLIRGTVYRVKLNAAGDATVGPTLEYFKARERYRDVFVAPDGRTIYMATDANSQEHPGAIVAFTYQPN